MLLAVINRNIYEFSIFLFLRRSENQGRICGSILRLVLVDCRKIARVADDGRAGVLQLIKLVRHNFWTRLEV